METWKQYSTVQYSTVTCVLPDTLVERLLQPGRVLQLDVQLPLWAALCLPQGWEDGEVMEVMEVTLSPLSGLPTEWREVFQD